MIRILLANNASTLVTFCAVIEEALIVVTLKVDTFSVAELRFVVPVTVRFAIDNAWVVTARFAVVSVLETVKLVVVRVFPTVRSVVMLAEVALSWPATTTSPEVEKGDPVTENKLQVMLVAFTWVCTTRDDPMFTLANAAVPATARFPVAFTRPSQ